MALPKKTTVSEGNAFDAKRQYLHGILDPLTNCARHIKDPSQFLRVNALLLRTNFLKVKSHRLVERLATSRIGPAIDLSRGKSCFPLHASAEQAGRDALLALRREFNHRLSKPLGDEEIDPEFFHYLDLLVSGFEDLREPLDAALGYGPDFISQAKAVFFDDARHQTQQRLQACVEEHLANLMRSELKDFRIVVVAGSSVYFANFVLEAIMQPGMTLLVPEYTFYGTINTILPIFTQPGTPDCRVEAVPECHHGKVSAQSLRTFVKQRFDNDPECVSAELGALWLACPSTMGTTYREEELEQLAEVVREFDITVVCDEIFAGLGNYEHHLSPAAVEGFGENLIVLNTSSKLVNLYDGDHILKTDLISLGDIFTEDTNVCAALISFCLTRNERLFERIKSSVMNHPFTLTRAAFAEAVLRNTPKSYFRDNSAAYMANLNYCRQLLDEMIARLGRSLPTASTGWLVRPLVETRAGQFLAMEFEPKTMAAFGIEDSPQWAAFLYAQTGLIANSAECALHPGQIAVRVNFAAPREQLASGFAALEGGLQLMSDGIASGRDYSDYLPVEVRELASETWELPHGMLHE